VADLCKFSATSFYPGRNGPTATSRSQIHIDVARENDPFVDLYGNDSKVETEDKWFDDTHIEDVASKTKNVSKLSEAIATEVCFITHYIYILITFSYRDQYGTLLGQVSVRLARHRVATRPHCTRVAPVVEIMSSLTHPCPLTR
jgi:hypothetical protein